MEQVFDAKQIELLEQKLDPRLVSERVGGGNTKLKYIEGHDAIDQANRIFLPGNWSYRPLSCEQTVLLDPMTGEAVGVSYKAQVELVIRGCVAPLVEVGSQPVAAWNVNDAVMSRRKRGDNKPVEEWERVSARRTIVESHEMAEKGAVTDALKRALRTFGDQFGNGLYGDGRVELPDADVARPQGNSGSAQNTASNHSNAHVASSGEPVTSSMIDKIKASWASVYNIADDKIEERWTKYKVYVLGSDIADYDLKAAHLGRLNGDIETQRRKAPKAS